MYGPVVGVYYAEANVNLFCITTCLEAGRGEITGELGFKPRVFWLHFLSPCPGIEKQDGVGKGDSCARECGQPFPTVRALQEAQKILVHGRIWPL